jgi:nitroreductase
MDMTKKSVLEAVDAVQSSSLYVALQNRKSCRKFKVGTPVDDEHRHFIEWAAHRAPYASGGPRGRYYLRTGTEELKDACFGQKYVAEADVVMIFVATDTVAMLKSEHPKYIFDIAASCMCADLMATALGYGTCWIGHFNPVKVKELIRTDLKPVIILLVGARDG